MPVNVSDHMVILEQDKTKLGQAIQGAVSAVLDKYREAFVPDLMGIPAAGSKIEVAERLTKNERRKYRAHVRICQVLEHYQALNLDAGFLTGLETYLRKPNGKGRVPAIKDAAVADELAVAQKRQPSNDIMRLPAKMILLTLVTERVLLLPMFAVSDFIPSSFGPEGNECLLDLLHRPLRELVRTLTPRFAGQSNIDWSETAGSKASNSMDIGSDYNDWKPGGARAPVPGYALSVGAATTWQDITDVDPEELEKVSDRATGLQSAQRSVKLYLNCLYLSRQSEEAKAAFFKALEGVSHYRIYTPEYKIWAKRASVRRASAKRETTARVAPPEQRLKALEAKLRALAQAYIEGKLDEEDFVASIKKAPFRRNILNFDGFPQHGPFPEGCGFDWQSKMAQWQAAFAVFKDYKNYEAEAASLSNFTSFFLYVGFYLPAWTLKYPDSGIEFPEKLSDFTGAKFVHRPKNIDIPNVDVPPLTFRQFNERFSDGLEPSTVSTRIRVVRDMFNEVIPAGELLGIPHDMANPVKESSVPASGGRPAGSTKAYIPPSVVFLTLLYCYRLLDFMQKLNEELLGPDNLVLGRRFSKFVDSQGRTQKGPALLRDLKDLEGFALDTSATFDGKPLNFDIVPARLFHLSTFNIKGRGETQLLDTGPLEQIIVMFETGLRGQSVQWLSTDFDKLERRKEIVGHDMCPLYVNTDKVKKHPWTAFVAGRVINLLRERRRFRDTLADEVFERDVYYEGNLKSKWGKFKPVFSVNEGNGFPHNDNTYREEFKLIFYALQRYIDELGLNYVTSEPDETQQFGFKMDATPHSARKAVVMQAITYLPPEYIGKYITGQTPRTVAYYASLNPESFDRVDNHQDALLIMDAARRAVDTSRGPEVTEPHKPSSAVAKAFHADAKKALHDFGVMSTAILDQDVTGADLVLEGKHQKLAFESTHICPFGSQCPPERKKQKLEGRCNFCDFALRSVDHLPGIANEMRNLLERTREIIHRLDHSGKKLSEPQRANLEKRRKEIGEDFFSLSVAECVLNKSLKNLKAEYRKAPEYFCFTPEVIVKNLEAVPFPTQDEGLKYVLSRLKEAKTYVSLNDRTIKAKIAKFSRVFMSKSDSVADIFKDDDLDRTAAEVYSFVHGVLSARNLTLDEFVTVLNKDVSELAGSSSLGSVLMPDVSTLAVENSIEGASL